MLTVPIVRPDPPQASIEALNASLPKLAASAGMRKTAPNFAAILASTQCLARPGLSYPVYTLGLTDIGSGAGLGKAKLAAWRHEFSSANEVVSAEVSSGRRPKFLQMNLASKFRSVQHELQSVAACEVFASRSYELRVLQVSALGLRTLWLKAESGSRGDVVVPLSPAPRELTANQLYTPHEFIAAIKAIAQRMLAAEAPGKSA